MAHSLHIAAGLFYNNQQNSLKIQKKSRHCEFSEILGAADLFSQFCSLINWCAFALSEESCNTILNHHFLQMMMDLGVSSVSSFESISAYCSSTLFCAHVESTIKHMHFEGPAILIANHSSTESVECGKKKKHMVEMSLSLTTRLSYSVATRIMSSLFVLCS